MADQNDLNKPDLTSNYSNEVLETIRGHIARLWKGDYTGMGNLVSGLRRWVKVGTADAKLVERDSAGAETTIVDTSLLARATGSNASGTWGVNINNTATTTTSLQVNGNTTVTGNLGVGTSSPTFRLVAAGSSTDGVGMGSVNTYSFITLGGYSLATDGAAQIGYERSTGDLTFGNGTRDVLTERMRIGSNGFLVHGKTTTSIATKGFVLQPDGNSTHTIDNGNTLHVYSSSGSSYRFYVSNTGVVNATSTTITAISDQRLKENIRDLDDGLAAVMRLKPRKFDWKEGKGENKKNSRGFIAQEFEQVFPDMVSSWIDPAPEGEEQYKSINANLIPSLVKAIQEQQDVIQKLIARVELLESKTV